MKHRRVRHVRIAAVYAPRRNNLQRWCIFLHVTDLHRRSMGAQQVLIVHIKRIVHGARRMIFRNIQRGKIVKIGLDFGSFCHFEP